nr:hypothetical protein [Tanacetum cinerariifolium]
NLRENGPTSMGFDMSKVKCYNCHRKGHFARECRPSTPIIEDWVSDLEDDSEAEIPQNSPSFVQPIKQVKTPRSSVKTVETSIPAANHKTAIPKPKSNGNNRNRKACFVCKSLTYLIKDFTTTVRKTHVTRPRPAKTVVTKPHSPPRRSINHSLSPKASNFPLKVTTAKTPMVNAVEGNWIQVCYGLGPKETLTILFLVQGNPQHALKDKGVIDSGCLRYMTGNMSYLSDFEEINGGYVAFGGNPKGGKISGKGKIRTGKLDFDDVYFVKELKFNLFSVSQMCDKKINVLFTDTEKAGEDNVQQYVIFPVWSSGSKNPQNTDDDAAFGGKKSKFEGRKLESEVHVSLSSSAQTKQHDDKTKREAKGMSPIESLTGYTNLSAEFEDLSDKSINEVNATDSPVPAVGQDKYVAEILRKFGLTDGKSASTLIDTKKPLLKDPDVAYSDSDYAGASLDRKSTTGGCQFLGCRLISWQCKKQKVIATSSTEAKYVAAASRYAQVLWIQNQLLDYGKPTWLFDIDTLTKIMNYQPVTVGNQSNPSAEKAREESAQKYALFSVWSSGSKNPQNTDDDAAFGGGKPEFKGRKTESKIYVSPSSSAQIKKHEDKTKKDAKGKKLEDITYSDDEEDVGADADFTNLETTITVSPIPTTRVHKDHHVTQIIGDLSSATQTRSMTRVDKDQDVKLASTLIDTEKPLLKDPDGEDVNVHTYRSMIGSLMYLTSSRLDIMFAVLELGMKLWPIIFWKMVFKGKRQIRHCLSKGKKGDILLVQIYVDDIIFGSTNKDLCKAFEKLMKDEFEMSSMGELTFFLGLQVKQKPNWIFISQDKYVAEILRKFGLTDGKPASTPINTEKPLLKDPDGEDVDVHTYRSMIGSLMYLTSSRSDIMFAVCACARFQVTPKVSHLHAVKRIFRYLKGKPHLEELEKFKRHEKEAIDAARKDDTYENQNANTNITNLLNAVSTPISTAGPSRAFSDGEPSYLDDPLMPHLEDIYASLSEGIFTDSSYDDEGVVIDFNNLETTMNISPTPTTRIHTIHPKTQILGDPVLVVQTRSKVKKNSKAHALVSYIQKQQRNNHKDFQHFLFTCFLSQIEPKKISQALEDESWVDAMQEELLQFQIQKVCILVDLPFRKKAIKTKWVYRNKKDERGVVVRNKARLVAQGHMQEEGIYYDEVFAPVAKIEAIRIFLAFTSYMGFIVYQMNVKSAFLYGTIDEEVKQKEDGIFISQDKPDIKFTVCACSRFQVTPKNSHLQAMKRIFRKSTTEVVKGRLLEVTTAVEFIRTP